MLRITFVQLWGIPELKLSAQSGVVYPGFIAPRSPKMGWIESWTKTVVVFSRYRLIGWPYYRLCENFWWLVIFSREQSRPNFGLKNDFLLSFTRILSFFWELGVLAFDITKNIVFAEILVFSNIFVFSSGKLGPKMDQNYFGWLCRIWRFFTHCVCLIRDKVSKPLVKISARWSNILGSKARKFKKNEKKKKKARKLSKSWLKYYFKTI